MKVESARHTRFSSTSFGQRDAAVADAVGVDAPSTDATPDTSPSQRSDTASAKPSAKQIADEALASLSAALASGKSEQLTAYLRLMSRFHRYSWGNVLMILAQRPDATRVAGFQTWKQMGRFVRKGEKGIVIIAPMAIKGERKAVAESEHVSSAHDHDGEKPTKPMLRFRGVYVFDVSQTDGEPLPELASVQGEPGEYLTRLRDAITASGITLDDADLPPGADGVSRGGHISVRGGMSDAQTFSVLVHEWAHELLHQGKRAGATGDDAPSADAAMPATPRPSKTVRETEAEAVAFVVCSAIGLATGNASADYIALYDGNADTLAASLARVQRAAAKIIGAVIPSEQAVMA
jgi:hypothetical protein